MTVADIMTKSVIVVTEETPIAQVATLLLERRFSAIPVLSADSRVVGIITANELFTSDHKLHIPTYLNILSQANILRSNGADLPYVAEQILRATAKDIMNQNVLFVRPELEIEKLAAYIGETWNDAVPVTDDQSRLLGIVTKTDLAKMVAHGAVPPTIGNLYRERPIDKQLRYVQKDMHSRFAYIAKVRANIWLTTATVLLVLGFAIGIAYMIDPKIFIRYIFPDSS